MKYPLFDINPVLAIDLKQDYQDYLSNTQDILAIKPAHIQGKLVRVDQVVTANLDVQVDLVLACAKTLKPVDYKLSFQAEIVFGQDEDADYQLEDPLDLTDIIFGYIVSEKPYVIYHPDASEVSFEEEKSPHPAFADLDKI